MHVELTRHVRAGTPLSVLDGEVKANLNNSPFFGLEVGAPVRCRVKSVA
jgi:hypothetical protein